MAANKTQATAQTVSSFLDGLEEPRQAECRQLVALMQHVTGAEAKMWGAGIVGFGDVHLVYDSGRELDWFRVGFSPRKAALTLYLGASVLEDGALMAKLGKHTVGKGCLYLKRLADADPAVLEALLKRSAERN